MNKIGLLVSSMVANYSCGLLFRYYQDSKEVWAVVVATALAYLSGALLVGALSDKRSELIELEANTNE